MSATAAPATTVRKEAPTDSTSLSRSISRRRAPSRTRRFRTCVILLGLLLFALAYVGVYASVAAACYTRNRLAAAYRLEKITNQRLRLELLRRTSPDWVISSAQRTQMNYADDYDYVHDTQTVASANKQR